MQPVETAANAQLGNPVLDALHRASRPDVAELVFEREFLSRLAGVLHAQGVAIWFDPGGETLYLRYKRDLPQEELQRDAEAWKAHGKLLKAIGNRGETCAVPAGWSEQDVGNPTSRELLIAPAVVLAGQKVVLEVFRDPSVGAVRQTEQDLRILVMAAQFAADRVRAQQVAQLAQSQTEWQKVDRYAQQVHGSIELEPTAFMIANEAAALLGCDRVTVAVRRRRDVIVKAVSGQSDVNRRSNLVRLQEKLGSSVLTSPSAVIVGPRVRQYDASLEDVVTAYLNESGAKTLFAIPLKSTSDSEPIGVLFLEQFDERVNAEQIAERANSVAAHATLALRQALTHEQVFLGSTRRTLGKALSESLRLRRLLLLGIVGGVVAALVLCQTPLRMEATGQLRAQVRRGVFAPEPGTVRQVPVQHAAAVRAGETIAVLENTEFQVQLQQATEELTSFHENLKIKETERSQRGIPETRKIQLDGEIAELQERIAHTQGRIELLRQRIASLTLKAPIDGVVATWDPQRQLQDRPVSVGTLLLSVIDERGPWRLELKLPESDAGPVLAAWNEGQPAHPVDVEFMLATHPEHRYHGVLESIAIRTENIEQHPVILLTVALAADNPPPLRDGAEVRAKIDCGERSLGYVVFRELVEFFHSRVLFRF